MIMKTHIKRAVRHGIRLLSCVTAMSQRDFCESENAAAWAAAAAAAARNVRRCVMPGMR